MLELVAVALVCTCGVPSELPTVAGPTTPVVTTPILRAPERPAIPAAPKPSLTARVISDGVPLAGVEVSISDGSKPVLATARTDDAGVARFADLEAGPYEAWATGEALASPTARLDVGPDSTVELVLAPATAVRGRVIIDGKLPAGSTMQFVPLDTDHAVRVAAVDDQGHFAIAGVPHGWWRVESTVAGYAQTEERVEHLASASANIEIKLDRTGTVSGTVLDPSGAPVANATIVLRDQTGAMSKSSFSISATRTRWIHPLAGKRQLPGIEGRRFGAGRPGSRPAECGRGHCGLDLGHERGSVVHAVADGEVVTLFPESRTEAGRVVVIQHAGGLKSFYMHLDELRPGLELGQPIRAGDPVGLLGGTGIKHSSPHLHFAMTHERLGRTWYIDPEPMIRHAVVLPAARPYESVGVAPPRAELDTTLAIATVTTDAKGTFRVDGVTAGSYVAVAYAPEFPPAGSTPFTVRTGEDTTGVIVRLLAGVMVDGRVLGRDGAIAGATVVASAGFGESANKIATTTTNRNGEFMLRSLSGKVTLTVSAPGYGDAERTIVVDERSRPREEFRLTIEDGQLRGVVLAPDGGAADGVSVRVVEGTTRRRTFTDAQGRFTIAPVASGRYVLEIASSEFPSKRVALDSNRFVEARLEAGGGLRAVVRDAHSGAALPGIRVEVTGPAGQTIARTSDARGTIEVRGLAAGEWKLTARGAGYVATMRSASVRIARVSQDVQLELSRGATLAGVVRDSRGQRVANARVWLGTATTQTDSDGNFRLTDVPIGAGVLEADLDGRHGSQPLTLKPGDERMTLQIELAD